MAQISEDDADKRIHNKTNLSSRNVEDKEDVAVLQAPGNLNTYVTGIRGRRRRGKNLKNIRNDEDGVGGNMKNVDKRY